MMRDSPGLQVQPALNGNVANANRVHRGGGQYPSANHSARAAPNTTMSFVVTHKYYFLATTAYTKVSSDVTGVISANLRNSIFRYKSVCCQQEDLYVAVSLPGASQQW
jgi:hypothetical protein